MHWIFCCYASIAQPCVYHRIHSRIYVVEQLYIHVIYKILLYIRHIRAMPWTTTIRELTLLVRDGRSGTSGGGLKTTHQTQSGAVHR